MQEVRQKCLRENKLWEDADFKAEEKSLFFSKKPPRPFVWKRPSEITNQPKFVKEGAQRFDIVQGMLGDCWLLAALSGLTMRPALFDQVVSRDQGFDSAGYCGAFSFRFWIGGEWKEVIVDDRLPTYNNKLVFLHSKDQDEFWSALLEKAYAKVYHSYESLKGGQTAEAMEDFTGGLTESFHTKKLPKNFFVTLMKAFGRGALACCSIDAKPNEIEAKTDNGLVKGHAYTITSAKLLNIRRRSSGGNQTLQMVRVRNPWGNEREYNGPWSDRSREWSLVSDEDKKESELVFDDDGEFWMEFSDFCANFNKIELNCLDPSTVVDSEESWGSKMFSGCWDGSSAGGCRNFPDTFWKNPQYPLTLTDKENEVVVGLTQLGRRKIEEAGSNLTIGFTLYERAEEGDDDDDLLALPYDKDFFLYHASFARSDNFVNARTVTTRWTLPAGEYLIVPCTFKPGFEAEFMLRVFAEGWTKDGAGDHEGGGKRKEEEEARERLPPSTINKFQNFFRKCAGRDGYIDCSELRQILGSAYREADLSDAVCRSLINLFSWDGDSKLGLEEFVSLYTTLKTWNAAFDKFDKDKSGSLSLAEARGAFSQLDFSLDRALLMTIFNRLCLSSSSLSFGDFVFCCARISDSVRSYKANPTLSDWIAHSF